MGNKEIQEISRNKPEQNKNPGYIAKIKNQEDMGLPNRRN